MTTSWTPRDSDLDWLTNHLRLVADGGLLVFPSTRLAYQVNRQRFEMRLTAPPMDENATDVHQKTILVAEAIGWTVLE